MNVNKVFLVGRVVEAPEMRTTTSGQNVTTIRIATNRVWNDANKQRQEETEFHSVVAWRRLAEIASQYLTKGAMVYIEGRLQTRSWDDQQGNKKYRTEIIAENLQLGPKAANNPSAVPVPTPAPVPQKQQEASQDEDIPVIEENEDIDVKDIPF